MLRIAEFRKKAGLSQRQLQNALGMKSTATVSQWESGSPTSARSGTPPTAPSEISPPPESPSVSLPCAAPSPAERRKTGRPARTHHSCTSFSPSSSARASSPSVGTDFQQKSYTNLTWITKKPVFTGFFALLVEMVGIEPTSENPLT